MTITLSQDILSIIAHESQISPILTQVKFHPISISDSTFSNNRAFSLPCYDLTLPPFWAHPHSVYNKRFNASLW